MARPLPVIFSLPPWLQVLSVGSQGILQVSSGHSAFHMLCSVWLLALVDILLVRMTSDFVRPPEQRYNYPNVISGVFTLVREEGPHALFRGMGTNLVSRS